MQPLLWCVPPPTVSVCTCWGPQSPSLKLGCRNNLLPCQMHSSSVIILLQEISGIPWKSVNKQSNIGMCYHPDHPSPRLHRGRNYNESRSAQVSGEECLCMHHVPCRTPAQTRHAFSPACTACIWTGYVFLRPEMGLLHHGLQLIPTHTNSWVIGNDLSKLSPKAHDCLPLTTPRPHPFASGSVETR